ncbi:MAG: hypothetical protein ABI286_03030 [Edaphobacter sp.]
MNKDNLKERLAYFERRLEEAKRKNAAKEPHPRNFDAGYTTETFKTWVESIAVINERISRIKDQLSQPDLHSDSTLSGGSPR